MSASVVMVNVRLQDGAYTYLPHVSNIQHLVAGRTLLSIEDMVTDYEEPSQLVISELDYPQVLDITQVAGLCLLFEMFNHTLHSLHSSQPLPAMPCYTIMSASS